MRAMSCQGDSDFVQTLIGWPGLNIPQIEGLYTSFTPYWSPANLDASIR